ncbi:MAG: MBOAT family O-acyltransferase [Candidatus Omnitrophota bacterium]
MLFTSFSFFVFFAIILAFYFAIPHQYQWAFLLAASYFFYGYANIVYLPLLILPTFIVYGIAISISTAGITPTKKRLLLIAGLTVTLSGLIAFKYLPFNLLLPIGISFYTFKMISYLIDVYRDNLKAETHAGYFALYVSFFPQILAGPIDRAIHFIPELKKKVSFDYSRIMDGFKLMTWGFFKKLVIADRLSPVVDNVFNNVYAHKGPAFIVATFFYSIQVYCDFSAYSDMAIGVSKILGFKSMDNFNSPYFSTNITKFWNKWHISLSTWLRDYLFLPISYKVMRWIKDGRFLNIKVETWGYVTGISITMFLGGLWHGAKWPMVLWGTLHGLYLAASYLTKKLRKRWVKQTGLKQYPTFHRVVKITLTFTMVSFAWIFFRANTIREAFYIVSHLHTGTLKYCGYMLGNLIFNLDLLPLRSLLESIGVKPYDWFTLTAAIAALAWVDVAHQDSNMWEKLKARPVWVRLVAYYGLIMSILLFSVLDGGQFIYFKF